jgi:hypothetical protein
VGGILAMNIIKIVLKIVIGLLLIALAVIGGPLLMLWSLNTLFPLLVIPYTWQTWAAAFILSAPFSTGIFNKVKKD